MPIYVWFSVSLTFWIFLSVYIYVSVSLFLSLCICGVLSVCLSVCPSLCFLMVDQVIISPLCLALAALIPYNNGKWTLISLETLVPNNFFHLCVPFFFTVSYHIIRKLMLHCCSFSSIWNLSTVRTDICYQCSLVVLGYK